MPRVATRALAGGALVVVLAIVSASGAAGGLTSTGVTSAARDARARAYISAGERTAMGGHAQSDRGDAYASYSGRAEAFRLRPRTGGRTDVVHIYVGTSDAARTVTVGVYTNAHGRPGVLLSTGSKTGLRARAWGAVAIAPVALAAGRTYWLAVLGVAA